MEFDNGTPQGSPLSPTIFNYLVDVLLRLKFPSGVKMLGYADDLVLYSTNSHTLFESIQESLDMMQTVASNIGIKFSPRKTKALYNTR